MDRWARVSMVAAGLAMLGNLAGLVWADAVYGREVTVFVQQAVAQDVVDLVVVGPALLVLAAGVLRGSDRAWLLWLGALAFTVYNYVIYAFTIHVGRLSLLWMAVLGLSVAALGAGLHRLDPAALAWSDRVPRRTVGLFLVVVGVLFALLWLSELLPAVVRGTVPSSARELGLPANPVHVLDLSFFLPAVVAAGVLVLRRRPLGLALAPGLLLFLVLTGLPILLTPLVASWRGESATWAVVVPIGVLTLVTVAVLARLVPTLEEDPARGRRA